MDTLLFDFGGTLDSDGQPWIERFYRIYEESGVKAPRPRFDRAFYDSDDNLPQRFSLRGLSLEQTISLQVRCVLESLHTDNSGLADAITARFLAESRASFQRLRPVLERLRGRCRLGIVSNFYGNLDSVLESEGLRGLFSTVVDSGVLGVTKPDKRIFLRALDDLSASPAQAFMIGDSIPRDMRGAESLDMGHVLVGDLARPACCPRALRAASVADLESVLSMPEGQQPVRRRAPLRAGIIAAGDGARLKSSHPGTIKPLIPIRGRPLCHWVAAALHAAGVDDLTVLFNSRGRRAQESLAAAFPQLRWTFLEKDTASSWESFRLVAQTLAGSADDFLISTVDAIIPPAEVRRFAEESRRAQAPAALALTPFVDDEKPLWAGLDGRGRVTSLGMAPRDGATASGPAHVTCGLYYLTAATARAMPPAQAHGRLRDYLAALVRGGLTAGVVLSKTLDVDRPEDIRQAEDFVAAFRN